MAGKLPSTLQFCGPGSDSYCVDGLDLEAAIRRALHYTHGNKRKAARLLHIGKTTLYRKLKQYDLE